MHLEKMVCVNLDRFDFCPDCYTSHCPLLSFLLFVFLYFLFVIYTPLHFFVVSIFIFLHTFLCLCQY